MEKRIGWTKQFSGKSGYGFIRDILTKDDVFVHYSSLVRTTPGFKCLYRGEYVQFIKVSTDDGRSVAKEVTGVNAGPLLVEAQNFQLVPFE